MTTRRERRELEAQETREREARQRRERRLRITAFALGSVLTAAGGALTVWKHLPGEPVMPGTEEGRDPASLAKKAEQDQKGKSLEELNGELREKEFKRKRSKEWAWAESGHTEKVIEAYRSRSGRGSSDREERVKLLNILGNTLKARKDWPPGFNDQRANELVDFLAGILQGPRAPGPEPVAAVNALAKVAVAIPELLPKAEKAILVFYGAETRPGPRGDCLEALASFQSAEGLGLARSAVQGTDPAMIRSGIYALAEYAKDPRYAEEARKSLRRVAGSNPTQRALAVKLLAHYGDRQIASMVPTLLREGAPPPELEAGAYAVGHLKLKQYKDLLIERSVTDDPVVRREIDDAMRALNE